MTSRQTDSGTSQPGPLASLGAIARNALALAANRIELATLELGQARDNALRLLLLAALGLVALMFALACWTALAVVLAWDALGWKILLLIAMLYTLAAVAILFAARGMIAQGKLSLPVTMEELRKDRDALL